MVSSCSVATVLVHSFIQKTFQEFYFVCYIKALIIGILLALFYV